MKKTRILAAAVLFVSGSAVAGVIPQANVQKWERNRDRTLCSDYAQQFKDNIEFRGTTHVPASARKAAKQGESLCRAHRYGKGDEKLKEALAMVHASAAGEQVDAED